MHSPVFVFIRDNTQDIEQEVTNLLAGSEFDPNKEFPTYKETCSCVGFIARRESMKVVDSSLNGQQLWDAIKAARSEKNLEQEHKLLSIRFDEVSKLEKAHPQYNQPNPQCVICFGNGAFTSDRNPRLKWDWWVIGGRWTGKLEGFSKDLSQNNDVLKGNVAFVQEIINADVDTPAALITPDGYWYESPLSLMSEFWNAEQVEGQKKNWENFVTKSLEKYKNHIVVIVDCHS